jgi:hypothetical protein
MEKMKMKKSILTLLIFVIVTLTTSAFAVEFSADVITQLSTGKTIKTGKIYFKDANISRNEMTGMITIRKRPLVYQLFSKTKKYYVTNIDNLKKKDVMANIDDFDSWIKENNMKKVGKETLAGYKCKIYEGDIKSEQSKFSPHIKLWMSKKLNYPLKTEVILPPPMGTFITYLENITVGRQDKSLFTVPSDYVEAKTMQEAMGMPDIGALMQGMSSSHSPAGNQMPSPQEQEEMMKKMQEMMKSLQQNQ